MRDKACGKFWNIRGLYSRCDGSVKLGRSWPANCCFPQFFIKEKWWAWRNRKENRPCREITLSFTRSSKICLSSLVLLHNLLNFRFKYDRWLSSCLRSNYHDAAAAGSVVDVSFKVRCVRSQLCDVLQVAPHTN